MKAIEGFADAPFKTTGGAIGSKLGSKKIGQSVGSFLGKIAGTGDYRVRSNSILGGSATIAMDSVPQFMKKNSRETRVTHREFLGKIVASTEAGEFKIQSFPINPGLFETFPWLSVISGQFDQWKPNGIVVVYKTMSSTYSGTSSLGTITMASDYDVDDPQYANTVEMNNSDFAVSTNVATSLLHPLECSVAERPNRILLTRQGTVSSDKRWYDLCNVQVATEGCTAGQVCGELWITYDISFYKTQINRNPIDINRMWYQSSLVDTTDADPVGTLEGLRGNLPITFTSPNPNELQLNFDNSSGNYTGRTFMILLHVNFNALTSTPTIVSYMDSSNSMSNESFDNNGTSGGFTQLTTPQDTITAFACYFMFRIVSGNIGTYTINRQLDVSSTFDVNIIQVPTLLPTQD